jgi:hypothetical protein
MTTQPKQAVRSVEEALRAAFQTVEMQPTPTALADHVDRITAPARRPDRRS